MAHSCVHALLVLLAALCATVSGSSHPEIQTTVDPINVSMSRRLRGNSQAIRTTGIQRSLVIDAAAPCQEPAGFLFQQGTDSSDYKELIMTCDIFISTDITAQELPAVCSTTPTCAAYILAGNATTYCLYSGLTYPLVDNSGKEMKGPCDGIYIKSDGTLPTFPPRVFMPPSPPFPPPQNTLSCTVPDGFSLHRRMDAYNWNDIIITCVEGLNVTALYVAQLCLATPMCAAYVLFYNQTANCLYSSVTYPLVDEGDASMYGNCDGIYIKSDSPPPPAEDSSTEDSSTTEPSTDSSSEDSSTEESSSVDSSSEDSSTEESSSVDSSIEEPSKDSSDEWSTEEWSTEESRSEDSSAEELTTETSSSGTSSDASSFL